MKNFILFLGSLLLLGLSSQAQQITAAGFNSPPGMCPPLNGGDIDPVEIPDLCLSDNLTVCVVGNFAMNDTFTVRVRQLPANVVNVAQFTVFNVPVGGLVEINAGKILGLRTAANSSNDITVEIVFQPGSGANPTILVGTIDLPVYTFPPAPPPLECDSAGCLSLDEVSNRFPVVSIGNGGHAVGCGPTNVVINEVFVNGCTDVTIDGIVVENVRCRYQQVVTIDCVTNINDLLIVDNTDPVITNCPNNEILDCTDLDAYMAPTGIMATDTCSTVTVTPDPGQPVRFDPCMTLTDPILGQIEKVTAVITNIWNAQDECMNMTACTQVVYFVDTNAPTFVPPDDVILNCTDPLVPFPTPLPIPAMDVVCDQNPIQAIPGAMMPLTAVCPTVEVFQVIYTATDNCGNSTNYTQTFSRVDRTGPMLECPDDLRIGCNETVPAAAPLVATDTCDGAINAIPDGPTAVPGSYNCPTTAVFEVVYTATDDCGNISMCTQTIVQVDTNAPVFDCPVMAFIEGEDATLGGGTSVASGNAGFTGTGYADFGGAGSFAEFNVNSAGSGGPVNLIFRYANGSGGNRTSDIIVNGSVVASAPFPPTGGWTTYLLQLSSGTFVQGNNIVRVQASPGAGPNLDNLTVQSPMTPLTNLCDQAYVLTVPTVTDDCLVQVVPTLFSASTNPFPCVDGIFQVITNVFEATDGCNTSFCTQVVVFVDDTAPMCTDATPLMVGCVAEIPPAITTLVGWTNAGGTATDLCSSLTITLLDATVPGLDCSQIITQRYVFADVCGNTSTCMLEIAVNDDICPTGTLINATNDFGCVNEPPNLDDFCVCQDDLGTNVSPYIDGGTFYPGIGAGGTDAADVNAVQIGGTGSSLTFQQFRNEVSIAYPLGQGGVWNFTSQNAFPGEPYNTGPGTVAGSFPAIFFTNQCTVVTMTDGRGLNLDVAVTPERTTGAQALQVNASRASQMDLNFAVSGPTPQTGISKLGFFILEPNTANTDPKTFTVEFKLDDSTSATLQYVMDDGGSDTGNDEDDDVWFGFDAPPGRTITGVFIEGTDNLAFSVDDVAYILTCGLPLDPASLFTSVGDNCGGDVTIGIADPFESTTTNGCRTTVMRNFTLADECGNVCTQSQVYTWIGVDDHEPPTIVFAPGDTNLGCNPVSIPTAAEIQAMIIATDNCEVATNQLVKTITNITGCTTELAYYYRIADACWNIVECVHRVTWTTDTTPPDASNVTALNLGCNPQSLPPPNDLSGIDITDDCGLDSVTILNATVTTAGCSRVMTRFYLAVDNCGNSNEFQQTITWTVDQEPPSVVWPPDQAFCVDSVQDVDDFLASLGENSVDEPGVLQSAENNPFDPLLTNAFATITVPAPPVASPLANCQIVSAIANYTVANVSAFSNAFVDITVAGMTPPSMGGSTTTGSVLGVNGATAMAPGHPPAAQFPATGSVEFLGQTASPITGGGTIPTEINPGDELSIYFYDVVGNFGTDWTADITVDWTFTYSCNDALVFLGDNSTDNCGVANIAELGLHTSAVQNCELTVTLAFGVFDACGNMTPGEQHFSFIIDPDTPTLLVDDLDLGCNPGYIPTINELESVNAFDGCGSVVVTGSMIAAGNDGCLFSNVIEYIAVDPCGNSVTQMQMVTWTEDVTPPVFTNHPGGGHVGCDASAVPVPADSDVSGTDDCGTPVGTFVSGITNIIDDCTTEARHTYRLTDDCGNFSEHTVIWTWTSDMIPPDFIDLPQTIDLGCNAAVAGSIPAPDDTRFAVTDNCEVATAFWVGDSNSVVGCDATLVRTYAVVDVCGNTNTETVTFNWTTDTSAPTLNYAHNSDLGCLSDFPTIPDVVELGLEGMKSFDLSLTPGVLFDPGVSQMFEICVQGDLDGNNEFIALASSGSGAFGTNVIENGVQCGFEACTTYALSAADIALLSAGGIITFTTTAGPQVDDPICPDGRMTFAFSQLATTGTVGTAAALLPSPANEAAMIQAAAMDACGGAVTASFIQVVQQTNQCRVTMLRTYRLQDDCGNINDVLIDYTWLRNNETLTATVPPPTFLGCDPNIPAPDKGAVLVTGLEDCGTFSIAYIGDTTVYADCNISVERIWEITDDCETIRVSQFFTGVIDNSAPIVDVDIPEIDLGCATLADVPHPTNVSFFAEDNCVNLNDPAQAVINVQTQLRTACETVIVHFYTFTDQCGNQVRARRTIRLQEIGQDTEPPQFVDLPQVVDLGCNPDQLPVPDVSSISVTDNCAVANVWFSNDTWTGPVDDATVTDCTRTNVRTYMAQDICGNISSQTITFVWTFDITPPTIDTIDTSRNAGCVTTPPLPDPGMVTGTDNCDGAVSSTLLTDHTDQIGNCDFAVTWIYRLADSCGNFVDVTTRVDYRLDPTPPTITRAPTPLRELGCNPLFIPDPELGRIDGFDQCGPVTKSVFREDEVVGCTVILTDTYTLTDECNNQSTATQIVTYIIDDEAPRYDAFPVDENLGCNPATIPAPFDGVVALDDCLVTTNIALLSRTTNDCLVTMIREYTAEDGCGNINKRRHTLTWTADTVPPFFVAPTLNLGCNPTPIPPSDVDSFETFDDCEVLSINLDGESAVVPNGCDRTMVRTFTATDACGNTFTGDQVVNWTVDTKDPVIDPIPVDDLGCNPTAIPLADTGILVTRDNCGVMLSSVIIDVTNNVGCIFEATRVYRVMDFCGNFADREAITTWREDTEAPEITCPADVDLGCNPGAIPPAALDLVLASDNCELASVQLLSSTDETTGCDFTRTHTFLATDICGNTATCQQVMNWTEDVTPPTINDAPLGGFVGCDAADVPMPTATDVTASDDCGVDSIEVVTEIVTGVAPCTVESRHIYRISDGCGNITEHSVSWTYTDDGEAPSFVDLPQTLDLGCNPSGGVPAPDDTRIAAADDCGIASVFWPTNGNDMVTSNGCDRTMQRFYVAIDNCGKTATGMVSITWTDDLVPPTIIATEPSRDLGCNPASIPPADVSLVMATDDCGTPVITHISDVEGEDGCHHTLVRTYRATDECGNFTDTQTLLSWREDTTAPTIAACPSGGDIGCNPQIPQPNPLLVQASDSCGEVTVSVENEVVANTGCDFTYTITYAATDDCGNKATCDQVYTYTVDTEPPVVVSSIAGGDLGCNPTNLPSETPVGITATDNCGATQPPIFISQSTEQIGCVVTLVQLFRVADACGNTVEQDILYTWTVDKGTPTLNCLTNEVMVERTADGDLIVPDVQAFITASDACGATAFTQVPAANAEVEDEQDITITVRDDCGNESTCTIALKANTVNIEGFVWTDLSMSGTPIDVNLATLGLNGIPVELCQINRGGSGGGGTGTGTDTGLARPDGGDKGGPDQTGEQGKTNAMTRTSPTGEMGYFEFLNLSPGEYILRMDPADLPASARLDPNETGGYGTERLIKINPDGSYSLTAADGTVLTNGTKLLVEPRVTTFGFSPTPTAAEVTAMTATAGSLAWEVAYEDDVLGYRVIDADTGEQVNDTFILAQGNNSAYSFDVGPGTYIVQEIGTDLSITGLDAITHYTEVNAFPLGEPTLVLEGIPTGGQLETSADYASYFVTDVGESVLLDVSDPENPVRLIGERVIGSSGTALYFSYEAGSSLRFE